MTITEADREQALELARNMEYGLDELGSALSLKYPEGRVRDLLIIAALRAYAKVVWHPVSERPERVDCWISRIDKEGNPFVIWINENSLKSWNSYQPSYWANPNWAYWHDLCPTDILPQVAANAAAL